MFIELLPWAECVATLSCSFVDLLCFSAWKLVQASNASCSVCSPRAWLQCPACSVPSACQDGLLSAHVDPFWVASCSRHRHSGSTSLGWPLAEQPWPSVGQAGVPWGSPAGCPSLQLGLRLLPQAHRLPREGFLSFASGLSILWTQIRVLGW